MQNTKIATAVTSNQAVNSRVSEILGVGRRDGPRCLELEGGDGACHAVFCGPRGAFGRVVVVAVTGLVAPRLAATKDVPENTPVATHVTLLEELGHV